MGGPSYQRLAAQDSSFLMFEAGERHVHVTAVAVFEGGSVLLPQSGALDIGRLRAHVESRLHRLPTYRRRLHHTPVQGHPIWVDDARFDLHYHVRHASLARPGNDEQLKEMAAQIASVRLDRERPLWELWFVEGLCDARFAVVAKIHHSLLDGVSGVSLLTALLGADPDPRVAPAESWSPRPAPGWLSFLADGAVGGVRQSVGALRALGAVVQHPQLTAEKVIEAAVSGWATLSLAIDRPRETPFNRRIGTQRRIDWRVLDLARVRELRKRLDGSVNDVVLTIVSGAMRRFLKARRVKLGGSELRVIVPVDTRSRPEDAAVANRVAAWALTLPVGERDPLRRFSRIRTQTRRRKRINAERAIDLFFRFADWSGSTSLTRLGVNVVSVVQPYNLIVTNVPGPQFPLYILDAPLRELVPTLPLFENQGIAVAVMSYGGRLHFGLTADRDLVPDLSVLADAIAESFRELCAAAERQR